MYAILCTRPNIHFVVGMASRYQSKPGHEHWSGVKTILKYMRKTKEYMLIYKALNLLPVGHIDSDFLSNKDKRKSTPGYIFTLGGGIIIKRSVK